MAPEPSPHAAENRPRPSPRRRAILILAAALWGVVVGLPPLGLLLVREDWIARLDRPDVVREWDRFREDMRRQTGTDGPVQRKVPKSNEPPGLVWLRDHTGLACAAWLFFGTVLWGMVTLFAWGAAGGSGMSPGRPSRPETDGPRTGTGDPIRRESDEP
jgi:hypothetical protein